MFQTVLVHVDITHEGRARLRNAAEIAQRRKAKLFGVGAFAIEQLPDPTGMAMRHMQEWTTEHLDAAKHIFQEVAADVPGAVWQDLGLQRPAQALAEAASGADLIVASRTDEVTAPQLFAAPEDLVLSAGVPVLVQPPNAGPLAAKRILVAWKNTREARRAIGDSLPFLRTAEEVRLVCLGARGGDKPDGLDEAAARLRAHGVEAIAQRRAIAHGDAGEELISAVRELGGDLIVAGAYGHSRLQELVLGGVTRSLLLHAPVYLLLSH